MVGQHPGKDQSRNLGDPAERERAVCPNDPRKSITEGLGGEADRSEEEGNDRGVKGPYWKQC